MCFLVLALEEGAKFSRVHTIVIYYSDTQVANIFDAPVEESQKLGRSLVKAFTAAAAQARYTYGVSASCK